jgi:hypothetical protein
MSTGPLEQKLISDLKVKAHLQQLANALFTPACRSPHARVGSPPRS